MMLQYRFLTCIFALALGSASAWAQENARSYAVLSLVGNQVSVVNAQDTTGSRLNKNIEDTIPITAGSFDKAALLVSQAAIKRADPTAKVTLLAPNAADLFEEQQRFFTDGKATLPEPLLQVLKQVAPTHLVLITKERGPASFDFTYGNLGSGKLYGLGLYLDRSFQIREEGSAEAATGFLAAFAYIKLSLIDMSSYAVVANRSVRGTRVISAIHAKGGADPSDVLSPAENASFLRTVLEDQLSHDIPKLLETKR